DRVGLPGGPARLPTGASCLSKRRWHSDRRVLIPPRSAARRQRAVALPVADRRAHAGGRRVNPLRAVARAREAVGAPWRRSPSPDRSAGGPTRWRRSASPPRRRASPCPGRRPAPTDPTDRTALVAPAGRSAPAAGRIAGPAGPADWVAHRHFVGLIAL